MMTKPLGGELEAIRLAVEALHKPPEQIVQAQKRASALQRQLAAFADSPEEAVKAYNKARQQILVKWALRRRLGYCSMGKHLAPLKELVGVAISGAYASTGYYETLHHFHEQATACREHSQSLRGGSGRYEGEYRDYQTFELKNPAASLTQIDSFYLEGIARSNSVQLPPEAHYDRIRGVTVGDQRFDLY